MKRPVCAAAACLAALCMGAVMAADRTWTGAGATANISDAANWQGGTAPAIGDNLILPAGPSKTAISNDLSAASFSAIKLTGGAHYTIGGSALTLTGDYSPVDLGTGTSELVMNAPVHMASSQPGFGGQGPGVVRFRGSLYIDAANSRFFSTQPTRMSMESPLVVNGSLWVMSSGAGYIALLSTGNIFPGGLDFIGGTITLINGAIPDGTRVNFGDYAVVQLDDTQITTGDFECRGTLFVNLGVGAIRVTGNGNLYHCWLYFNVPSPAPPQVNGEYVIIRDDGPAAMMLFQPIPDEGYPLIVNGASMALTYHGGPNGRSVSVKAAATPIADAIAASTHLDSLASGEESQTEIVAYVTRGGVGVQGARVTFTSPASCGTVNGQQSSDSTTGGGYASVLFRAGSPGRCFVTAAVAGTSLQTSFPIVVYDKSTVRMSAPYSLLSMEPNQRFTFSVSLLDARQNPVTGQRIVFDAGAACGTFGSTQVTATTDANGVATPQLYTAPALTSDCFVSVATEDGAYGTRIEIRIPQGVAILQLQDMWWSGPGENGWGMSLLQHNDTLVAVLYVYDDAGKPTWFVMPGGTWDNTHTAYTMNAYSPKGSPFFAYDVSKFSAETPIGYFGLQFQDASHARLFGAANGHGMEKNMVRMTYGKPGTGFTTGLSDMWWGGTSQNGWGVSLLQHDDAIFGVWFTYDANGAPLWYVMPGGTWTASDTYEGHVYRTTGSPWLLGLYSPAQLQVMDVGTFRMRFTGTSGELDYVVDGHPGTLALQRQPF